MARNPCGAMSVDSAEATGGHAGGSGDAGSSGQITVASGGRRVPSGHPGRAGPPGLGACSEHPGDDGEGHGGAAGLQLQSHQEALGGGRVIALSLEDLAQPVPDLMGRGVHLHGVPENLLGQAVAAQLVQDQGLWASEGQTDRQTVSPGLPSMCFSQFLGGRRVSAQAGHAMSSNSPGLGQRPKQPPEPEEAADLQPLLHEK